MIVLKSILVPTNFSEKSEVAVRYGAALAAVFRAKLCVLHVVHETFAGDIAAAATLNMLNVATQGASERLTSLLTADEKRALASAADHVVRIGAPTVEIVEYAREHGVDLIVVATRGRGAVAHMLEGSVVERLLRKAPCPMLVVRHPEHEFVLQADAAESAARPGADRAREVIGQPA